MLAASFRAASDAVLLCTRWCYKHILDALTAFVSRYPGSSEAVLAASRLPLCGTRRARRAHWMRIISWSGTLKLICLEESFVDSIAASLSRVRSGFALLAQTLHHGGPHLYVAQGEESRVPTNSICPCSREATWWTASSEGRYGQCSTPQWNIARARANPSSRPAGDGFLARDRRFCRLLALT
jgi:hypothetical protein